MTLDNIYKLLLSFDEIYDRMTEDEQKLMLTYLVKNIQIYANDEGAKMPLKSITLNFPVFKDNREVNHILWDKNGSVETLVVLSHKKPDGHINVKVEFGEEGGQVSLKEVAKRAEERKLIISYIL